MTDLLPLAESLDVGEPEQIAYASARIRSYCGWHIYPSITSTVTLDADGGRLLMLPTLHMTALTTVTITEDASEVDAAEMAWSQAGMVSRPGWRWPCGFRSVTVEFVHGYDDLPDEIAEVAVAVATRVPAQMASVSSEAAGGVSRQYGGLLSGAGALSAGWTMSEQMVLDRYRIPARP